MGELGTDLAANPPTALADILAAWNEADAQRQRELLGALFDELDVQGGRIVRYKPRPDHAAEVVVLMERVFERRINTLGCSTVVSQDSIRTQRSLRQCRMGSGDTAGLAGGHIPTTVRGRRSGP